MTSYTLKASDVTPQSIRALHQHVNSRGPEELREFLTRISEGLKYGHDLTLTVGAETPETGTDAPYSLAELQALPTLERGTFSDLKVATDTRRVWLSRMTRADGAITDNWVTVEAPTDGRWDVVAQYPAQSITVDQTLTVSKLTDPSRWRIRNNATGRQRIVAFDFEASDPVLAAVTKACDGQPYEVVSDDRETGRKPYAYVTIRRPLT